MRISTSFNTLVAICSAITAAIVVFTLTPGNVHAVKMTARQVDLIGASAVYFFNEPIPANSLTETTLYKVGQYDSLSVNIAQASGGNITTANIIWQAPYNGTTVTIATENIRLGTQSITRIKSDIVTIQIPSNTGSIVRVTGNIFVKRESSPAKRRVRANLSYAVSGASSTVTITESTKGFWFVRSDAKIYLNFAGFPATSSHLFLNANDSLDTGIYLQPGDKISMLSASGTTNLTGFTYE